MDLKNVWNLGTKELRGLARDWIMLILIAYSFSLSVWTSANSRPDALSKAAISIVDEDQSQLSSRITSAFYPPYFVPPNLITAAEVDRRMDAARMSFGQKDIPAALAELDEALEIDPESATLFNLRGSCHVELRDFESALADFRKAAGRSPRNPSIRFNIAEVLFVTKRWEESLAGFEEIRNELTDPTLAALVDFKILLCNEALGHSEEFQAGMIARQHDEEGPSRYFTRAAGAYHANVPDEARKQLTAAKRHFPDPATLAPWLDTLVEFGWLAEFP